MRRLVLLLLSIFFINCSSPTKATIPKSLFGSYRSDDTVFQKDYFYINISSTGFIMWLSDEATTTVPTGNTVEKIGLDFISGMEPTFSFQSTNVLGSLVFFEKSVKVSFYRRVPPYLSAQNVYCVKLEQQ